MDTLKRARDDEDASDDGDDSLELRNVVSHVGIRYALQRGHQI